MHRQLITEVDLSHFPVTGTRPARYVVLGGHTLGYIYEGSPWMGILAGSVLLGGYDPLGGPVAIGIRHHELRPATQEDFSFFRVRSKGHLT